MKKTKTRFILSLFSVLLMLAVMPIAVLAGTDSSSGISFNFPSDMLACNPTFKFTTTGIDSGWEWQLDIFKSESGVLTRIGGASGSGNIDYSFTPEALADGQTTEFAAFVAVYADGKLLPKMSGQWTVTCEKPTPPPPPPGDEGCTPGYWKQKHHYDSWTGYSPNMTFASAGFENAFPGMTLGQVVGQGGGGLNALGRHTVAALLNAASPGVEYAYSTSQVISQFNAVFPGGDYESLKNTFEMHNESGCPLN